MNVRNVREQPLKRSYLYGFICFILGLLLLVALIDYVPHQSMWISTGAIDPHYVVPNKVGVVGVFIVFWSYYILGISAWLMPIYLLWYAYGFLTKKMQRASFRRWAVISGAFVGACGLMDVIFIQKALPAFAKNPTWVPHGPGGLIGHAVYSKLLEKNLGTFGGTFLLLATFLTLLILSLSWKKSPQETLEDVSQKSIPLLKRFSQLPIVFIKWIQNLFKRIKEKPLASVKKVAMPQEKTNVAPVTEVKEVAVEEPAKKVLPSLSKKLEEVQNAKESEKKKLQIFAGEKVEKAIQSKQKKKGDYIFPSINLLSPAPEAQSISDEELQETMERLVATLAEFGVKVTPGEVHTGPVVTRYEVIPAAGVRVEKISGLSKNIALTLKALSVRILAPVPGKASVGIEIPNGLAAPVYLREILESKAWADSNAEIPIVLGKEVTGRPLVYDLTKMPHLLIAGSTGSGKTVCINTIIVSLLYHASPEDLRFIMVDPKIVEMQLYNDIPHMLIPVVTSPKKVPAALKWLISEMEKRYQIFAAEGVRNIAAFNAKILKNNEEREKAKALEAELSPEERAAINNIQVPRNVDVEIPSGKMPYIVCIVDELADLMIVAPADIEMCVMRLAQLARAAGIHLILATQRPSVNVITGVIKANLPCRIAFKVASKVDSRTILDGGGADQLIGKGDMLFIPPGVSDLIRAQGAFASDPEINGVIDALKVNGPPEYADHVQRQIESSEEASEGQTEDGGENWDDELVPAALDIIKTSKRASTSILQRRLRIGYNRAARIMEILEKEGIVGPENAQKPREILIDLES